MDDSLRRPFVITDFNATDNTAIFCFSFQPWCSKLFIVIRHLSDWADIQWPQRKNRGGWIKDDKPHWHTEAWFRLSVTLEPLSAQLVLVQCFGQTTSAQRLHFHLNTWEKLFVMFHISKLQLSYHLLLSDWKNTRKSCSINRRTQS